MRKLTAASLAAMSLAIAACGGGGSSPSAGGGGGGGAGAGGGGGGGGVTQPPDTGGGQASAPLSCAQLDAAWKDDSTVVKGTATLVAATATLAAHCQVDMTVSEAVNIRIALPLSGADGGSGGVQGAWNGKVQNLGGGGYAGSVTSGGGVPTPGAAASMGYVGSETDTGHSTAWCNTVNTSTGLPNSQQNCGNSGGGFVLDSKNNLIESRVDDFIRRSLLLQVQWSLKVAKAYYAAPATRNYWYGCSTGGRQGFEAAQSFGELFDGIVVESPAMNWNRFIMGNMWAPVVTNAKLGATGLPTAKSAAANAAAIAACDAIDGVTDGIINEPRKCNFNANALICTGAPGDPATCLTPAEAETVNSIWQGPTNTIGEKIWGGPTYGTSFNTNLPGGNNAGGINLTFLQNWLKEDPTFDWKTITPVNYGDTFLASAVKFKDLASTENPNLDRVKNRGGKIIHMHGLGDALIYPFTSENYASRVIDRYGVQGAQSFIRSYFFPGLGHCGGVTADGRTTFSGDVPQPPNMFNVLTDWVEKGIAPDYVVASQPATSTRPARAYKVCMYPDQRVYNGGDPNSEASYSCQHVQAEPPELRQKARTFLDP